MKLLASSLKKDLFQLKAIKRRALHDEEILVLENQINLLESIIEDLSISGECIIEER